MREHACDEWGLFYNQQWLIDHYIDNGGHEEFSRRRDNMAGLQGVTLTITQEDERHLSDYGKLQMIESFTCPINRKATKEENSTNDIIRDDWWIFANPDTLIMHYALKGGAEEFAKRRKEFFGEKV